MQSRFVSPPARHDGTKRVKMQVSFSGPIEETPDNVGEHGVDVEGAEVTPVSPVGGSKCAGRRGDVQKDPLGRRRGGRVGVRDQAGLGRRE